MLGAKTETLGSYKVVWCYSRAGSIHNEEGLHFGADIYAHNYKMQDVNLVNARSNGYTTVSKKSQL